MLGMMQHQCRLALDYRHSSAASEGSLLSIEIPFHLQINSRPHIMSVEVGTSILDAALACIGERLSAILLRPADGGRNYITSLHNEVVSITQCAEISGTSHQKWDLARCRVDHWHPVIYRQLHSCAGVSQSHLSQFFGH